MRAKCSLSAILTGHGAEMGFALWGVSRPLALALPFGGFSPISRANSLTLLDGVPAGPEI